MPGCTEDATGTGERSSMFPTRPHRGKRTPPECSAACRSAPEAVPLLRCQLRSAANTTPGCSLRTCGTRPAIMLAIMLQPREAMRTGDTSKQLQVVTDSSELQRLPSELTGVNEMAAEAFSDPCCTGELPRSDRTGRDQRAFPSHAKRVRSTGPHRCFLGWATLARAQRPVLVRRPSDEPLTLGINAQVSTWPLLT